MSERKLDSFTHVECRPAFYVLGVVTFTQSRVLRIKLYTDVLRTSKTMHGLGWGCVWERSRRFSGFARRRGSRFRYAYEFE